MHAKLNLLLFLCSINLLSASRFQNIPKLPKNPTKKEVRTVLDTLESRIYKEFYSNNYIKVLEYGDAGLDLANSIDDAKTNLSFSRFIGSAFIKMRDTVRAKEMMESSLLKAKMMKDPIAIGKTTSDMGNLYYEFGDKTKAISYYIKALKLLKGKAGQGQIFILHHNLSEIYLDSGDLINGEIHVKKQNVLIDSVSEVPMFLSAYQISLGKYHLLKNDFDKALDYIKQSIEISEELNYVDNIINGYETYLEILVKRKDFEAVYDVRQKLDIYKDEKIQVEKAAAIQGAIAKMNVEQYKQELKAQELESQLNEQRAYRNKIGLYMGIVASFILSIFLLLIMRSSKKRKDLVLSLQERNVQFLNAKKKAEELSKVKTNFLSAITHELRTPLYGIIGISSLLQEDESLKKHKEDITSLKFSADYLLAMVNDLLFLNRLEEFKEQKLEQKVFRPRVLIENIINSLEFMRKKHNNNFNISISPSVPHLLRGDYVKLSQIVINLASNACKFTEEGTITIALTAQNIDKNMVSVHFLVADDGLGISKDKQAIIFDEFTQDRKNKVFAGTGLGLSIVKRLIDMHNTTINLRSWENIGSEFQFSIDYLIATKEEELETVEELDRIADKSTDGSHILVVDDNKINRLVTQKILERNNYVCSIVANGKEALEIVKEEVFDLILMDVNMPVMDGFEATAAIRKFNTDIPIIALTANDPSQMGKDIQKIGFSDVIIKPYENNYFLDVVKNNFRATAKV
ncbi:response regulator [uncultured Croceitalea sp.]|uniref:response regulator n=1 Tax=uncultured Croceitalea sp. TaxID=1798908 RepID=UPI00374E7F34